MRTEPLYSRGCAYSGVDHLQRWIVVHPNQADRPLGFDVPQSRELSVEEVGFDREGNIEALFSPTYGEWYAWRLGRESEVTPYTDDAVKKAIVEIHGPCIWKSKGYENHDSITVNPFSGPNSVPSGATALKAGESYNSADLCLSKTPSVSQPASLWHAERSSRRCTLASLLASISESKDWQSLPRPVVECVQGYGVRVAEESDLDQPKFGRAD